MLEKLNVKYLVMNKKYLKSIEDLILKNLKKEYEQDSYVVFKV